MKFIAAVFILSGMIIGAGMFGIPFSFARAGFWLGTLELCVLTAVVLAEHLLYAEVVLSIPETHQMPGYIRRVLGRHASLLSWGSTVFGTVGALLAYVLLGSSFLQNIVGTAYVSETLGVVVMVVLGAIITRIPLRKETAVNSVLTVLLVGFIVFFAARLFPHVDLANIYGFSPRNLFIPYGVLLFALSGSVVIPDLIAFLGRDRIRVRRAIVVGTVIPAVLYVLFAFVVVGVSGPFVSREALAGIGRAVGDHSIVVGSIVGFLAVLTSLLGLSESFQGLLVEDLKFSSGVSWGIAALLPALLYVIGFTNFIAIIGAVGVVSGGIDATLIIASNHALKRRGGHWVTPASYIWKIGIVAMVVAGVLYELYTFVAYR